MAYRADIEIGVKGIQQLQALTKQIDTLAVGVDSVNKRLAGSTQSLNAYNANLAKAAATLNKVNAGTVAEADAVRQYVAALGQANAARDRQNRLIQQQINLQRKAIPTVNAGFGVQGPNLPPIGKTSTRSGSGDGISSRIGGAVSGSIIGGAFPLLFGQGGGAATGGAIGGLVGGLAGPGGSFAGSLLGTLLGDIASKGQTIKQLAVDIGFSTKQTEQLSAAFKVANTDVEKFTSVIQNIRGLGLEIEDQAKAIQLITRLTEAYGGSFEKTGNAITNALESGKVTQATLNQLTSQGINIQQALADKYDVSRSELLKMAKDGEISAQSLIDTLVEVANAGTTGATKIRSSYEETATSMSNAFKNATTGINSSFTSIQNTATTAFDRIVAAISPAVIKLAEISGKIISLGVYVVELGVKFASAFYAIPGTIQVVATAISNMIPGLSATYTVLSNIAQLAGRGTKKGGVASSLNLNAGMDGANWPAGVPRPGTPVESFQVPSEFGPTGSAAKGAKGPKPPEDRTKSLLADLQAITEIGNAENLVRDLLFEGRDLLAAEVELSKALADIERDRIKQLEQANYQSEKDAINKIAYTRALYAEQAVSDKIREINSKRFEEELRAQEAVRSSVRVFTDLRKEQELQAQYGKTYLRLVTEGMLPAEATRIANFEKLVTQQLNAVEEQIKITELALIEAKARGASTTELEKQLKTFKDQQAAIKGEAAKGPGEGPKPGDTIKTAVAAARGELNELIDLENQVVAAAKAIGDAFTQAFRGLVSGAMTGQQALAAFFQGVGDHFMDMASKMLAKLIEIYILETVLGFITGAVAGGSFGSKSNAAGKATFKGSFKGTGASTFGSGGIRVPGYAEGGFVTGPTRALIGEGGESEYVIPASKMGTAMSRYSAGARGAAVIPGNGASGGGGTVGGGSGSIDVRYTVERINSVDYVTADQFQRGMAQAAKQGAEQGERRALSRLQNSPSVRRRVGV